MHRRRLHVARDVPQVRNFISRYETHDSTVTCASFFRPPKYGTSPDLEKLRLKLKKHFEIICNAEAPVIFKRPVRVRCYVTICFFQHRTIFHHTTQLINACFNCARQVLDINFGLNNQEAIKNMKIRGALARQLDLATEKAELMNKYSIHTEKEVFDQVLALL